MVSLACLFPCLVFDWDDKEIRRGDFGTAVDRMPMAAVPGLLTERPAAVWAVALSTLGSRCQPHSIRSKRLSRDYDSDSVLEWAGSHCLAQLDLKLKISLPVSVDSQECRFLENPCLLHKFQQGWRLSWVRNRSVPTRRCCPLAQPCMSGLKTH